ncbi:hypothetical protein P5706_15660 [Pseudomonas sp. ChxA]|uniref:hypothetical protein n=1 Tax=Pseudomonas sp. ChxA TaxID=3035473 RepID=UPI002555CE4B|nr:hypothetical protein [Pseudomonas sp. ChxA]MDL2185621.1 hypothetical protein [Pseudomonas sp. ChxA]
MSETDFPPPQEFILSSGLYQNYPLTDATFPKISKFVYYTGTLDTFCVECGSESVFKIVPTGLANTNDRYLRAELDDTHIHLVKAECSRQSSHVACYIFRMGQDAGVTKIGQFPSKSDADKEALKKYRKVLSDEHQTSLATAVGLFSHGVGAGSIVYLRKIFEALIEEAHAEACEDPSWVAAHEAGYKKLNKMRDKVEALEAFLPSDLVSHPRLYSFLSVGLHTLTEQKCKALFPMLKLAIEFILDQKLDKYSQKIKRVKLDKLLSGTQL